MASAAELQIVITGRNDASKALNDAKESAGGLGKALGDVSKIAGGFVLAQGIMQAPKFLFDAAQAAADDAASTGRLQKAIENTGASYADYSKEIDAVIKNAQRYGQTDDQVRDSLSLLTAQTGDATEAQRRFKLAQDLSKGANIDLVTASKLLGKVTDENVNVLARYGIAAKEGMTETELFGLVQEKFGGQAEAFAGTTAAKMEEAKIRMGELKEALGAQLLPVITAVMSFLVTTGIPALEKFAQAMGPEIKKVIDDLKPTIASLQAAIQQVVAFIQANWPTISAVIGFGIDFVRTKIEGFIQMVGAIVEIVTSVVSLVSALFHGEWSRAWQEMKDIAGAMVDLLLGQIKLQFGNIPGIILGVIGEAASAAANLGESIVKGIMDFVSGIPGDIKKAMQDIGNAVYGAVKMVYDNAISIGKAIVDGVWDGIQSLAGWLKGQITGFFSGIVGSVKSELGIGSPSKVFAEIGENMVAGLDKGLAIDKTGILSPSSPSSMFNADASPATSMGGIPAVNFYGPVTIQAQSRREAQDGAGFFAWGLSKALQSRGYA